MALLTQDLSLTAKSGHGKITYTYILRITQNSTDPVKNCSHVTVEAILKQTYSGTAFSGYRTGVSCTVDGETLFSDYCRRTIAGKQEHVFYVWEGELPHREDGSRILRIGGKLWQTKKAEYTPPTMLIPEAEVELASIDRASQVGAADGVIGGRTTVVITPAAQDHTHTLHFQFGAEQGYICQDGSISALPVQLQNNTISFLLPESLYYQIPNKPWDYCTLTCTTYSGETAIGQQQAQFRVSADSLRCWPKAKCTVEDVNPATLALTGRSDRIIRYMSSLRVTLEAEGTYGAGIARRTVNGISLTQPYLDILQADGDRVHAVVEDTRGYRVEFNESLGLIPYVKLTNNARVQRTAPTSGQALLTFAGNCFRGSFGQVSNSLRLRYRLCPEDGEFTPWQELDCPVKYDQTYETEVLLTDLDYTKTYTLQTVAMDALEEAECTLTVLPGVPAFHWKKDGFFFHVPVAFDESLSGAYIRKHTLSGTLLELDMAEKQSVFLLGGNGLVCGCLGSTGAWWGSPNVTVQCLDGHVTVSLPQGCSGELLLISTCPICIK
jgi:hypothetical protein